MRVMIVLWFFAQSSLGGSFLAKTRPGEDGVTCSYLCAVWAVLQPLVLSLGDFVEFG